MGEPDGILELAEAFLREEVRPKAAEIDRDPEALRAALRGLCERGLMALRRPQQYGGPALAESHFRHFQEQVARYSGALAFLQTQHQSAGSMIGKSSNEWLKSEYLPKMASGEKLVGIGFSQLRRSGPPAMRAKPVNGGYILDGQVPWITGYTFYPEFLIGATLPDGEAVFGVVPLDNVDTAAEEELNEFVEAAPLVEPSAQGFFGATSTPIEASFRQGPPPLVEEELAPAGERTCCIRVSEPMKLAAMESALTVSAEFENWFLPDRMVCFIQPSDWIKNNDMINIVLQGHFALGCARGSLDVLHDQATKKSLPFLQDAYQALDRELEACREATAKGRLEDNESGPANEQERLRIRAWAIDLAVRCAHAAVAASSGAANTMTHPAQRLYREALVYTVSAQTPKIMEATLERLVRPKPGTI
jgi:alkylation response protein AidB-like acyl-CoA dehydrogenase